MAASAVADDDSAVDVSELWWYASVDVADAYSEFV